MEKPELTNQPTNHQWWRGTDEVDHTWPATSRTSTTTDWQDGAAECLSALAIGVEVETAAAATGNQPHCDQQPKTLTPIISSHAQAKSGNQTWEPLVWWWQNLLDRHCQGDRWVSSPNTNEEEMCYRWEAWKGKVQAKTTLWRQPATDYRRPGT